MDPAQNRSKTEKSGYWLVRVKSDVDVGYCTPSVEEQKLRCCPLALGHGSGRTGVRRNPSTR